MSTVSTGIQYARILARIDAWQAEFDCPCPHTALCTDLQLSEDKLRTAAGELIEAGVLVRSKGGPFGGYDLARAVAS